MRLFTCVQQFFNEFSPPIFMPCSVLLSHMYFNMLSSVLFPMTMPALVCARLMVVVCAAFLNMLCSLKWGIYVFFGAWQFIGIFFTLFLVPETRGVPIEEVCPPSLPCTHDTCVPSGNADSVMLASSQCHIFKLWCMYWTLSRCEHVSGNIGTIGHMLYSNLCMQLCCV